MSETELDPQAGNPGDDNTVIHAIIDSAGVIVNASVGYSQMYVDDGYEVIPMPTEPPGVWIGWYRNEDGEWTEPEPLPPTPDPEG